MTPPASPTLLELQEALGAAPEAIRDVFMRYVRETEAAQTRVGSVWHEGIPPVPVGGRKLFAATVEGPNGRQLVVPLEYLNRHVMPLSDSACPPEPNDPSCIPIDDDGYEYAWTGWHEPQCDVCECSWVYSGRVVAWMPLPGPAGQKEKS